MQTEPIYLGSNAAKQKAINLINEIEINGAVRVEIVITDTKKTRTPKQNNSLHLWLSMLADELNASGQSLGDGKLVRLPIRFSGDNLKENVLKPYMTAVHPDKDSTTQLSTTEIQSLYRDLDQIIAERTGVHCEWPSNEPPMMGEVS